ncbi:type II toxin-antitoxin system VapC family toxin [Halovivax cerinus]|uniref:Type II toxin-antitoxin system VapC family toxin n=1 Tax=Halovivax cerinus TaxID=1487865 RepID=A0ABD5NIM6_9EURY|nr:PIN domain-containing protein [Halovivax cerinus]
MSIIVDTGVIYADHDRDATRHDVASDALDRVYDGALGQPVVSTYIYGEAVTLTDALSSRPAAAIALGKRLRGAGSYPSAFELCPVTDAEFDDAVTAFEQYTDQGLSFTDATIVAQVRRRSLDGVLSFDTDFDGLVERFDPKTVATR